jgi:hypothetical protein
VEERFMNKTVLSFYVDDTGPYGRPVEAFKTFVDFVAGEGIAGESSVILGLGKEAHGLLSRPTTREQEAYIEQLRRAFDCGLDAHMELMTHGGVYDFARGCVPEGAAHEGVWLHEPEVSVAEYQSYFDHVIAEGERIGVRFTGVTWPGCGCEVCTKRYAALRQEGVTETSPHVWQALLNLARAGRFRGRTVPCFTLTPRDELMLMAGDGEYGVYEFMPNAQDRFGIWENDPAKVDADYYITADGQSGRIVELVRAGAAYCLFYAHWQGLNPANGVGWEAFRQVVSRVRRFLGDQVIWMRPSEYTGRAHAARG